MFHDIAPHRLDIAYRDAAAAEDDLLICPAEEGPYILRGGEGVALPTVGAAKPLDTPRYLFSIDGVRFFTARYGGMDGCEGVNVRALRHAAPGHLAFAAALGWRLAVWYDATRFCGRCGRALEHSPTERAMLCPGCGNTVYPSICPSVIIALTDGDRLLLTRYQQSHSPYRHHALCAGYIESGESAEDAVRRELWEEVGLRARNIRYYKSQPWPFTGALLLGFFCELAGDDAITRDENELSEALWVRREELPDRSGDVSLTSEMMEAFRRGEWK